MNTKKQIATNTVAIICIQMIYCVKEGLYNLSNINIDISVISLFFITFFIIFFVPFSIGSIISIFILQNVFQIILSQILFIIIDNFYRIYITNSNLNFSASIIEWTLIANVVSVFIVFLIKLCYKSYVSLVHKVKKRAS